MYIYIYTHNIYIYIYQSDLPRFGGSGTGTALGDPIEVGALRGVMQEGVAGRPGLEVFDPAAYALLWVPSGKLT